MIIKTDAIVLKSIDYSNSSKILTLYTKEKGRISVIAKGAAKPKSKFGFSTQILIHSEVLYYYKAGRGLQLLSASEIISNFKYIQSDFRTLASAMMIAELIMLTQQENEANDVIFEDMLMALKLLDKKIDPFAVLIKFQIKLAKDMGFALNFGRQLQNIITPNVLFSLDNCMLNNNSLSNHRISRNILEKLYQLQKISLQNDNDFMLSENEFININELLTKYFSFHLDKQISYKAYSLLML